MFSVNQILALATVLTSASAACVPRGGSGSGSKSSSVLAVPTTASSIIATGAPSAFAASSSPTQLSSSSVAPVVYSTSTSVAASSSAAALKTSAHASSSIASTPVAASLSTSASAVAVAAAAAASSTSSASTSSTDGTKYFVVFGDSYSSTGFYIEGGYPSASSPLGSGGSTTTGGLNWVGFVTETYNSSLVLTYDWAYYGADISNAIINTGVTTDLIAQVAEFEDNLVPAPSEVPWTSDNLLVAVWMGVNDIGECFWESAEYATCPIDDAQAKYFSLLQNLYDDGVRNFALNTVPPFYKAPAFDSYTDADLADLVSNLNSFNSKLVSNLDQFVSNNTGITAQAFNTTSYFWEVLDDPTAYGLDSDITASNTDGTSAVWYDSYHPGQVIHKLVAKGFVEALADFF